MKRPSCVIFCLMSHCVQHIDTPSAVSYKIMFSIFKHDKRNIFHSVIMSVGMLTVAIHRIPSLSALRMQVYLV